jgi:transposase
MGSTRRRSSSASGGDAARLDLERATIEIVAEIEVRELRARADDSGVTPPAEALLNENVELRAELAELKELVERLGRDNALLKEKLFRLMRQRYGPKGDRFAEGQLELFTELFGEEEREEPDAGALEAPDVELPEDPAPKSARRQKRQAREIDYQSLPREHRLHELPDDQRICPLTGKQLVPVGAKTFEELEYRPAELIVVEHERVEYGLSEEDRAERMAPNRVAPMPIRPIDQALAGPGLLARVLVAKYVDHLPLHRQEAIFGREGLSIPRQTLCEWTLRSIELLQPIVAAQKRRLLAGGVLQTDDTQVLCQENSTKGGRRWCFLWAWVGEDRREVVYDFSLGRDQDVVAAWIGEEWSGYLVGDGYTGYGAVCRKRDPEHRIIQVGCWAHYLDCFVIPSECVGVPLESAIACPGVDNRGYDAPDNDTIGRRGSRSSEKWAASACQPWKQARRVSRRTAAPPSSSARWC